MQSCDDNLSLAKDLRGGLVTFLGSAYIVVLIPVLLRAGTDTTPMTTVAATALACAVGSALFGLVTRLPFAVGPGIVPASLIAAFLAKGIPFPVVLGIEFFAGLVFLLIVLSGTLQSLVLRMSPVLKSAGQLAIGIYLLLAALKSAGIVPGALGTAASGLNVQSLVFLAGLAVTFMLNNSKRLRGYAILLGIAVAAAGSVAFGSGVTLPSEVALPHISLIKPDLVAALNPKYIGEMLILLYVVIVDAVATLETISSCSSAMRNPDGQPKNFQRAMVMSSVLFLISPFLGTAPLVMFFESLGGVLSGARTARASAIIVAGFLVTLLLASLSSLVPAYACAVALAYIGYAIAKHATLSLPMSTGGVISRQARYLAGTAVLAMVLTQSIALTIFSLFVAYPFSARKCGYTIQRWEYMAALISAGFMTLLAY
jgi:AGZA family xanthine/uracil permease-like MFS transporter